MKNQNSKKIILDLCGGTGSWSKPYRDAGYDVRLITSPEYDVTFLIPPKNVYGILAAPPCTMFSVARQRAKIPRDLEKGMETVIACLRIIWQCQYSGTLRFWALENPRGYLRKFLGRPAWNFKQWEFGQLHDKTTDIWGLYNSPAPLHKQRPAFDIDKTWQKPETPDEFKHLKLSRADIRAITPPGFAKQFFKANR